MSILLHAIESVKFNSSKGFFSDMKNTLNENNKANNKDNKFSPKELFAMMIAAFSLILPLIAGIIAVFSLIAFLFKLFYLK
jgi:hypothetical protein